MNLKLFLQGVSLMLCLGSSYAQPNHSQFHRFEGDGYYWYKQEPEIVSPKTPASAPKLPPIKEVESKPVEPKPLSVPWIKANMQILLDKAIEDPTKENVSNYMYAQRIVLDRSQAFSEMAADVISTDAFLDENNRVPIASFAQNAFLNDFSKNKSEVLKSLALKTGIWVFIDRPDKCSACDSYVNNIVNSDIAGLKKKYGFIVRVIDVGSSEGMIASQRFNLKITPTTMLISPPDSFYIVSQGLMAASTLHEKILTAARMNGLLDEKTIQSIQPYSKDLITKSSMDNAEYSSDPSVVMSRFREKLLGDEK